MRTLLVAVVVLLGGCASQTQTGLTQLSSAELTSFVEVDAASAAIRGGNYERALAIADDAVRVAPDNAWARYNRAVALRHMGQTDEAVTAFRQAEERFAPAELRGHAIAIYGRARALADVGRCAAARAAYREYADFVRSADPASATMALSYAEDCRESTGEPSDPALSAMTSAIIAGRDAAALDLAHGVTSSSPWFEYDRAVALGRLGRTDAAVAAYRAAERAFVQAGDPVGQRDAVYGRARVQDAAGRCGEAASTYAEYAALVSKTDPTDAERALEVGRACKRGGTR